MNILCFVVLAVTITAISCQVPTPCFTPPQWGARYFEYDPIRQDRTRARIWYDAVYQRERIIEEYTLGTDDEFYDILYLHSQQIQYVFSFKNKTCTKTPIDRPWRNFGIPANATSLGESYLGSSAVPNANLLTTIWQDTETDSQGNKYEYMGVWTYEACLPVTITYFSDNAKFNTHVTFVDIIPGIDDPNAFIPRKECLGK